ncbi:protein ACTIVITY OF BC1 COMPLEX KINASE 3, chloroplastic [Lathyrus oleraceus]|uniref:protein ACTIVITY OF BC1 COMPLEX KINASE 3, chloroplastic n=1 Tax=Pisum sativum TaxID=3888 RepID=UPI0021D2745B|nr:protein ACTIVITY OF BC1 COMPLEX KINASE 3, chloroplastic-like [Pisum sativum]
MDWVEGVKLSEQEAIERQGLNVLDLVNTGIPCSLRQLLEYGYFHADPHPGNLLATPDGRLAFLDFGMMSETPEDARSAIIGHVVHLVNRVYEAMARDYYAFDFLSPDVDISPIVPALRDSFDDALNYTVSELNFKTLVDGLGNVLYQFPFNIPAYYALILRSLAVLEGLALNADPNFKVLAASYPYFAKRLLTNPNPYLRDALIELLFKDEKFSAAWSCQTQSNSLNLNVDAAADEGSGKDFSKVSNATLGLLHILCNCITTSEHCMLSLFVMDLGAALGCSVKSCKRTYHVTCAIVSHPAGKFVSFLNNAKSATVGDAVKRFGVRARF